MIDHARPDKPAHSPGQIQAKKENKMTPLPDQVSTEGDSHNALRLMVSAWEEGTDAGISPETMAFAALYTGLSDLRDPERFGIWLRSIVRTNALARLRESARGAPIAELGDAATAALGQIGTSEASDAVEPCLEHGHSAARLAIIAAGPEPVDRRRGGSRDIDEQHRPGDREDHHPPGTA